MKNHYSSMNYGTVSLFFRLFLERDESVTRRDEALRGIFGHYEDWILILHERRYGYLVQSPFMERDESVTRDLWLGIFRLS